MKNLIFMDKYNIYTLLGDIPTFRISNFVILTFFHFFRILLIALAFCYLHISLTGQKIFADF